MEKTVTLLDLMKQADLKEEDAIIPEELELPKDNPDREEYFEFYDDIKTSIKEDW